MSRKEVNRRILAAVNRAIYQQIGQIYTDQLTGSALLTRLRASEGLELEGYETYDLEQPTSQIDFNNLRAHPKLLPLAILIEEVLARKYHPHADEDIFLFLDTSSRMRYPISSVYEQQDIVGWPADEKDACWPKPSLLKILACVLAQMAIETGFAVRIIEFSEQGIVEHRRIRHRLNVKWLCQTIDERLMKKKKSARQSSVSRRRPYEEFALRLLRCRGSAFVIGDFLDGCDSKAGTCRPKRTLSLIRQWALRRSLVIFRVNHHLEVLPTNLITRNERSIEHPHGDGYYLPSGSVGRKAQEHIRPFIRRMERQQQWRKSINEVLLPACRGFVEFSDYDIENGQLKSRFRRSWDEFRRR